MAKPEFYAVTSHLKQSTGVNYLIEDASDKKKKQSIRVVIPGKNKPTDPAKTTYLTAVELEGIKKTNGDGSKSPFTLLLDETRNGSKEAVIVSPIAFEEIPGGFQKKLDLARFLKCEKKRRADALKAAIEEVED